MRESPRGEKNAPHRTTNETRAQPQETSVTQNKKILQVPLATFFDRLVYYSYALLPLRLVPT